MGIPHVPITLRDMPVEVLVDIFSFLDGPSLLNAAQVSTEWNKLIEKYEGTLWSAQVKTRWGVKDLLLCGHSWKTAWLQTHPRQLRKVNSLLTNSIDSIQPSLADLGLSVLPTKLFSFTSIRRLYLYENRLSTLPPQITLLTNLRLLSLFRNQFTTIPEPVLQLTQLEGLWLYDNQITEIPHAISKLTNLSFLHLSNNKIKEVPKEIAQLKNLENLYLSGNEISHLPPELYQLTNLQTLILSNNKLTEISVEICSMKRLTKLELHHNSIKNIPEELSAMSGVLVNSGDNETSLQTSINLASLLPSHSMAPPPTFSQR